MADQDEVTLGELYRLCKRIETKVDKTNGRVTTLEKDAIRIKAFWTSGVIAAGLMGDYLKHRLFGGG